MRRAAIIAVVLAALFPMAAVAGPGGKGPAGGGPGAGPAAGPAGQAAGNPPPKGPGNDNGKGKDDKGSGNDNGNGPDQGGPAGLPPTGPADTDQTLARDALVTGTTLPLATIVSAATKMFGGRLIDARLFVINKTPVYRLTLITAAGVTRNVYYDARTAMPLGSP